MITVAYTSGSALSFRGNEAGYKELAALLRRGVSEIVPLNVPKHEFPAPYERFLTSLRLQETTNKIQFRVAGAKLYLTGAPHYWEGLSSNIDFLLANYRPDDHLHVEYYEGHWFIDRSSEAIILETI